MAIHSIQVRFKESTFDVWKVDEDTTCVLHFYEFIEEDLKMILHDGRPSVLDVTVIIRGGEHVLKVDSDASLIEIFRLNLNSTDVILSDVTRINCTPLAIVNPSPNEELRLEDTEKNVDDLVDVAVTASSGEHVEPNDTMYGEEIIVKAIVESKHDVHDDSDGPDDNVNDPEWNDGRNYSDEEVSSEIVGDYIIQSDEDHWSDADEDVSKRRRPCRGDDDDEVDPNSHFLDAPSHIGPEGRISLQLWQTFDDYKAFRDVLSDFCIQEGFEIKKQKFDTKRLTAICRAQGCPWCIHASKSPDGACFIIKTFIEEHTCQQVRKNKLVAPSWIASKLLLVLKFEPDMNLDAMRGQLVDKYGIKVDNKTLWKARKKAKEKLEGSHATSFIKLSCFVLMVQRTNPGSRATVSSDVVPPIDGNLELANVHRPLPIFKHIFICYDSVLHGFLEGYRPFLGLDGFHLKGPYKGILLAAVGIDVTIFSSCVRHF